MIVARFAAAALVAAFCAAGVGASARQNLPAEPGWLPLFNRDLVTWLENENRLDVLCPSDRAQEQPDCRARMLEPRPLLVPLRAAPDADEPAIGQLVILSVPGRGLSASFVSATDATARTFMPDLFLRDWGYGPPFFHQTYLERRGDWFRLPADPFPPGTWLNARDFGAAPETLRIETGAIYTSPRGAIVVLAVEPDGIRARPEQPADMWCDGERPVPPLEPFTEMRLPRAELLSDAGHLCSRQST